MISVQSGSSVASLLHKLVHAMDRSATQVLQERFGITYKRAYFLLTLQNIGTASQHQLATTLGYSDASVSTMLTELSKAGFVTVDASPSHGRKKVVRLTKLGDSLVTEGRKLLDSSFNDLMNDEHVNISDYQEQTQRLYLGLIAKLEKEFHGSK